MYYYIRWIHSCKRNGKWMKLNEKEREIWIIRINEMKRNEMRKERRKEEKMRSEKKRAQEWYVPQCNLELIIGIIFELAQWHTFKEMGTDFKNTFIHTHAVYASLSALYVCVVSQSQFSLKIARASLFQFQKHHILTVRTRGGTNERKRKKKKKKKSISHYFIRGRQTFVKISNIWVEQYNRRK